MKMVIENTQKMDLHLNVATKMEVKHVTIPHAYPDKETKAMVNGRAEVDGEIVAEARKRSEIVQTYFKNGWLREVNAPVEADDNDDVDSDKKGKKAA